MDIENLSKKELKELKSKIELKLRASSFVGSLMKIKKLKQKIGKLEEEILREEETSEELLKLKEIGFSIVFYDSESIGLINFSKPKINDNYYGVVFNYLKYELKNKKENPVSNDDFEAIKKILKIEG